MAAIEEEDNKFESWEEDNDDDEDQTVKSLFCDLVFPSVSDLIASDKESFGFDLREAAGSVQYDDIALIMLVNFIRRRVHGLSSPAVVNSSFIDGLKTDLASKSFLQDDTNMRPVLNDDPLLFLLRDALIASGTIVDDDDEEIEAKETQAAIASAQQQLQLAGGSSSSSTGGEELLKKYQLIVASLTAEPDATTKVLVHFILVHSIHMALPSVIALSLHSFCTLLLLFLHILHRYILSLQIVDSLYSS